MLRKLPNIAQILNNSRTQITTTNPQLAQQKRTFFWKKDTTLEQFKEFLLERKSIKEDSRETIKFLKPDYTTKITKLRQSNANYKFLANVIRESSNKINDNEHTEQAYLTKPILDEIVSYIVTNEAQISELKQAREREIAKQMELQREIYNQQLKEKQQREEIEREKQKAEQQREEIEREKQNKITRELVAQANLIRDQELNLKQRNNQKSEPKSVRDRRKEELESLLKQNQEAARRGNPSLDAATIIAAYYAAILVNNHNSNHHSSNDIEEHSSSSSSNNSHSHDRDDDNNPPTSSSGGYSGSHSSSSSNDSGSSYDSSSSDSGGISSDFSALPANSNSFSNFFKQARKLTDEVFVSALKLTS